MPDITIDNSAFSTLYCDRKFELTVKKGLVSASENPFSDFGSALHKALEHLDQLVLVEDVFERIFADFPGVQPERLVKAVSALIQWGPLTPVIEIEGKKAIEVKFKYLYKRQDYDPVIHDKIFLAGTIDRIELDGDTLVIRDYKTASDFTQYKAEEKLALYETSFQLPFYLRALLDSGILPAQYLDLLRAGKYRTEYSVVFYNLDPIRVKTIKHGPYPSEFLDVEVPNIISKKVEQAINILESSRRGAMTGLTVYAGCKYCPFRRPCLVAGTQEEEDLLARYNTRVYDPMTFR